MSSEGRRHEPWYMRTVIRPDGTQEEVPYCAYCDVPMVRDAWISVREGIKYVCYGWVCPICGAKKEEGYKMMR
ncbi:MAG: hypothetical protein ACP5RJ_08455 [Conexivisphaera sp.]